MIHRAILKNTVFAYTYMLYPYDTSALIYYQFNNSNYKPRILAITGKDSDAKEHIINNICKKYSYDRIDFADPVKKIAKDLFNFTHQQMNCKYLKHIEDKTMGVKSQQAISFLYKDVFQDKIQELLPNYDKRFLARHLIMSMHHSKSYIIGDLQFYHEYLELSNFNPYIIKIEDDTDAEYNQIPCNISIPYDKDVYKMLRKIHRDLSL